VIKKAAVVVEDVEFDDGDTGKSGPNFKVQRKEDISQ
jgi:hypothetical protein